MITNFQADKKFIVKLKGEQIREKVKDIDPSIHQKMISQLYVEVGEKMKDMTP